MGESFQISCNELIELTNVKDIHRLDRELDHLRSLNLIENDSGFDADDESLAANISPTALALNLYVKSQGFNDAPVNFWTTGIISKADLKKEQEEQQRIKNEAEKLRFNVKENAWDGQWYKRAYFDDGTPLGSHKNEECKIDSIAQSWSVLSKAGDVERTIPAMESADRRMLGAASRCDVRRCQRPSAGRFSRSEGV